MCHLEEGKFLKLFLEHYFPEDDFNRALKRDTKKGDTRPNQISRERKNKEKKSKANKKDRKRDRDDAVVTKKIVECARALSPKTRAYIKMKLTLRVSYQRSKNKVEIELRETSTDKL